MHSPPRILIVDDNETNRDILVTRLATQGYDLMQAADGEEAIEVARKSSPDLILLDVMMPKIDGIEATSGSRLTRPAVHADHPGHRQGRHEGRGRRARGRGRRISDQAGRPDGAGGARQIDAAPQGAARQGRRAGGRTRQAGTRRSSSASPSRSPRSNAPAGSSAFSRRRSPSSSCRRATRRCWKATAARSPSCSATCAASRPLRRPPSPRR